MYMSEEEMLMNILLIYLIALGVILIVYLVGYVLQGIGMYTMGKRKGKGSCWLAFVPYARVYFQGELSGTIQLKNKQIKNPGIWILLIPIVTGMVAGLVWSVAWGGIIVRMAATVDVYGGDMTSLFAGPEMIVFLVGLIVYVLVMVGVQAVNTTLHVLVNHQIYKECTPDGMAIAHAVLGIFIPLYTPICFFVLRERVPVEIPPINYGPYAQGPINGPVEQQTNEPTDPPIQNN